MLSAIITVLLTAIGLSYSKVGKQIRAIASDPEYAQVLGIPIRLVTLIVVALGSALAGFAGILTAFDRDLVPTMGMPALLIAVVVMIVGGKESIVGLALAGYLIGLIQNVSIFWLAIQWQDALVFFTLIVFLLVRPQGIMGKPSLKRTV